MRILIDECIDERFRNSLTGHESQTVHYAGMAGLKNGELLESAQAAKFDVLITVDQGVEFQQNLNERSIAIVILCARSNRLNDLLPLVPQCLKVIETIKPGQMVRVTAEPR